MERCRTRLNTSPILSTLLLGALSGSSGGAWSMASNLNPRENYQPRHRHQELLVFLRPSRPTSHLPLNIHVVMDNYATHKHA